MIMCNNTKKLCPIKCCSLLTNLSYLYKKLKYYFYYYININIKYQGAFEKK